MPLTDQNNEALKKKQSVTESVDNLISQKESQRGAESMNQVMQHAEGVQTEVADLMAGVDKPSDKISERKEGTGERRDIGGGSKGQSDDGQATQIRSNLRRKPLPSQEIMIKKIRSAINSQIELELKVVKKLEKNLANGDADEYNERVAKIRKLKEVLKSLLGSTFEVVKGVYFKYFGQDGKRKDAA